MKGSGVAFHLDSPRIRESPCSSTERIAHALEGANCPLTTLGHLPLLSAHSKWMSFAERRGTRETTPLDAGLIGSRKTWLSARLARLEAQSGPPKCLALLQIPIEKACAEVTSAKKAWCRSSEEQRYPILTLKYELPPVRISTAKTIQSYHNYYQARMSISGHV